MSTEDPTSGAVLILSEAAAPKDRGPSCVEMMVLLLEVNRTLKTSVLLYPRLLKVACPLLLVMALSVPLKVPEPVAGSLSAVMMAPITGLLLASNAVTTAAVLNEESTDNVLAGCVLICKCSTVEVGLSIK